MSLYQRIMARGEYPYSRTAPPLEPVRGWRIQGITQHGSTGQQAPGGLPSWPSDWQADWQADWPLDPVVFGSVPRVGEGPRYQG